MQSEPAGKNRPSSPTTSLTLLQRLRDGDEDAWTRLAVIYAPLIRHWLRKHQLQDAAILDITQEVLLGIKTGIGNFRRERSSDSFRGWLWTVTRNKHVDFVRRELNHAPGGGTEHRRQLEQIPEQVPDEEPGTVDSRSQLLVRVLDVVKDRVDPQTFEAFWRTAVENQTSTEVAADQGTTPQAVRERKRRVIRMLREEFGDLDDSFLEL